MIPAFPKIFAIGSPYIENLFDGEVEVSEKVDGSQFVFGRVNGELHVRSKGRMMYLNAFEKMFAAAIEYVQSIESRVLDNIVYYCEYLMRPKHNVLKYDTIPKNHLALFGVSTPEKRFVTAHHVLEKIANLLGIDVVPLLYQGEIKNSSDVLELLEEESYLGGTKVEGVVVKNYSQQFLIGGQPMPLMAGKYVSEKFKEKHDKDWKKEKTSKGRWQTYCEGFQSEARWHKAVQHLREKGELEFEPRDIGKLIKEIQRDIMEEEKESIKGMLWQEFGKDVLRTAIKGFPETYKEWLLKGEIKE